MDHRTVCMWTLLVCVLVTIPYALTRNRCVSRRRILFCDRTSTLPHFPLNDEITTLVIGDRLGSKQLRTIKNGFDGTVIVKGNRLCPEICDDSLMKNEWKHRCHCQVRLSKCLEMKYETGITNTDCNLYSILLVNGVQRHDLSVCLYACRSTNTKLLLGIWCYKDKLANRVWWWVPGTDSCITTSYASCHSFRKNL